MFPEDNARQSDGILPNRGKWVAAGQSFVLRKVVGLDRQIVPIEGFRQAEEERYATYDSASCSVGNRYKPYSGIAHEGCQKAS
jgi:hypothetical protein